MRLGVKGEYCDRVGSNTCRLLIGAEPTNVNAVGVLSIREGNSMYLLSVLTK